MTAVTLTNEETFYTSIFDDANEPILKNQYRGGNVYFTGDDGLTYEVVADTSLYRIDKDTVTRSLVESLSESEFQSRLSAVSGLTLPSASTPRFLGVLRPHNYLLFSQASVSSDGTNFSLWKVNSSGILQCVSGINYAHPSDIKYAFYYVSVCGVTNNQTQDDPILVFYGNIGTVTTTFYRAWRLPSINDFIDGNGTYRSSSERFNNNIDATGGWSETWGGAKVGIPSDTYRAGRSTMWMVPYQGGTRLYYYQGPSDVLADGTGVDSYAYQMSLLHGDQFIGYIDLGEVTYQDNVLWAPDLTRTVDMSLMRTFNNEADLLPFTLYNADGFTIDVAGLGDFGPGATWTKLSNGKFLVTMGCMMQWHFGDQYNGAFHDLVGRWMAFFYDPATGIHRQVGRGTFVPCTHAEMYGTAVSPATVNFQPAGVVIEYDETLQKLFFDIDMVFWGDGAATKYRNAFGMVDRVISFDFTGEPCFLTEIDSTHYDFSARYP